MTYIRIVLIDRLIIHHLLIKLFILHFPLFIVSFDNRSPQRTYSLAKIHTLVLIFFSNVLGVIKIEIVKSMEYLTHKNVKISLFCILDSFKSWFIFLKIKIERKLFRWKDNYRILRNSLSINNLWKFYALL